MKKAESIQPHIYIADVSTPGCFAGKWLKQAGIAVINSHLSSDDNNRGRALYFSNPKYGFSTDAIFCVSEYLLSELKQKVRNPDLVTSIIPPGVNIPVKCSTQDNECLKIVYAGRIIQTQKRINEIVQLFVNLAGLYKNFTFTFIGDGPDKAKCENIVQLAGMQNRIRFTGILIGQEYQDELVKHDVIILLSDYEGTPGSLIDGMAAGLIPVCFHYTGAEELITHGETGF